MVELKISLANRNAIDVPCSILFVKHIEGCMSAPEIAVNDAVDGKLRIAYEGQEKHNEDIEVSSNKQMPFGVIHSLVFHRHDLPFTYASVDEYARRILKVATRERASGEASISTVATAVHGPGAGLDTSEAMETLLTAFASELQVRKNLGNLREVILVERDKEIFNRLGERLKHLENKGIITSEGNAIFLRSSEPSHMLEAGALRQRSLKHVFVAMPYAKEFNNLYYFGIKEPIERRNLKCERVDHDKFVGDVVHRIKERIKTAELVIADITGEKANVFFEVGFAEGLDRPVILLSQGQDVPFDLHTQKQIRYDPEDLFPLSLELGETLDVLLSGPSTEA